MSAMAADELRTTTQTDGQTFDLGGVGVRFLIDGGETDGRFALVEHPLSPRALAAPMHRHEHEDEYSYVLAGRVGMRFGDTELEAGPGTLVRKPRGEWHTFWNAGDEDARILEIISPAGFEQYFREIADYFSPEGPDLDRLVDAARRYGLEFDMESIGSLVERHALVSADLPPRHEGA